MSTADDIKRLLVDLMDFAPHWSGNGMRRGGDYVLREDVEQVLYPAIDALASERDALKAALQDHQAKALDTSSRSTEASPNEAHDDMGFTTYSTLAHLKTDEELALYVRAQIAEELWFLDDCDWDGEDTRHEDAERIWDEAHDAFNNATQCRGFSEWQRRMRAAVRVLVRAAPSGNGAAAAEASQP